MIDFYVYIKILGSKGRCIFFKGNWMTPSQFEKASGLQACRDWRRSIKYGGQPILALMNGGHLKQHASSCTCGICCEDATIVSQIKNTYIILIELLTQIM